MPQESRRLVMEVDLSARERKTQKAKHSHHPAASGPGPSPSGFKRRLPPTTTPCAQPLGLSPVPLAATLPSGEEQRTSSDPEGRVQCAWSLCAISTAEAHCSVRRVRCSSAAMGFGVSVKPLVQVSQMRLMRGVCRARDRPGILALVLNLELDRDVTYA